MYDFGAKFIGADISKNQIAEAKRLSAESGMNIEYIVSSAEDIDFPDNSFDVVTACQCFMYFDKAVTLPKIHNMLKDSGNFVILFMAWLPFESEIAKASEEMVLKYNPAWTGGSMQRYTIGTPDWLGGFFEVANAFTYCLQVPFTRESWHGRMKACRGIGASSLSMEDITKWEEEHKQFLKTQPEAFEIPHFVSLLDLKKVG